MNPATYPLSVNAPLYPEAGRFAYIAKRILGIEGGHANNASDRGGETNFGISLRFLKLEGLIDLNHDGFADFDLDFDGDIDGADIRALTPQQSLNLYYHCFWQRGRFADLPKPIDGAVLDQAINGGIKTAVKLLQLALNRMALTSGDLLVDGEMGRITMARVGMAMRRLRGLDDLVVAYRQEAEARYNAIVRADASQVVYLSGWVARARRLGDV